MDHRRDPSTNSSAAGTAAGRPARPRPTRGAAARGPRPGRLVAACASLALAAAATACASRAEIAAAKRSRYDADFARIYSAAVSATRGLYPNLDDNPGAGTISTAWHQVQLAGNDDMNGATVARSAAYGGASGLGGVGGAGPVAAGMPTRLATKRYFIRFDVSVIGGRPWRVKVVGHASEWDPGAAMPTEMHGAARPPWLDGRTDSLTLAIYKRLRPFAVPMKDDAVAAPDQGPRFEAAAFAGVPAGAATALAGLKTALSHRDHALLRSLLADDVAWSLGGAPGAEVAMAMWQADAEAFDAMSRAIDAGCQPADGDARVRCPARAAPGAHQLTLEPRGAAWRVAAFLRVE